MAPSNAQVLIGAAAVALAAMITTVVGDSLLRQRRRKAAARKRAKISILGDVFVDIMVLLKDKLPQFGTDTLTDLPITMVAGGSGLNTATHLMGLWKQWDDGARDCSNGPTIDSESSNGFAL